jgi:hypothetical protein
MLQPLERRKFRGLKATSRHFFVLRSHKEGPLKIERPEVIHAFIEAWNKLSESAVRELWHLYDGGPENLELSFTIDERLPEQDDLHA